MNKYFLVYAINTMAFAALISLKDIIACFVGLATIIFTITQTVIAIKKFKIEQQQNGNTNRKTSENEKLP